MTGEQIAKCIGCGCDDNHACPSGCYWQRLDRAAGVGVCSECEGFVPKWNRGQREPTPPDEEED